MLKLLRAAWDKAVGQLTPIQLISGIMGIIGGIWAFAVTAFWPLVSLIVSVSVAVWTYFQNPNDLVPFIAGSSSALVFLSMYWLIRTESRAKKAALRNPNPTLRTLDSRRVCVVHSPKKMDYHYNFRVQAKQQGVQVFNLTFSWTGVGQIEFRSQNKRLNHKFVEIRGTPSTMLHIILERPLDRGEVAEFSFELATDGSKKVQRPFYAETVFPHTPKGGRAIIGVHFADGVTVQSLWKEEYVDKAAHWPYKYDQVEVPADRKFEWPLRAAVNRRCCISWEYGE